MFFQAPMNPASDMRKITPPRAMTGMVSDRLHSSLWVLIQNPKPTTSIASIMVKKLIHLMTKVLVLLPIPIPESAADGAGPSHLIPRGAGQRQSDVPRSGVRRRRRRDLPLPLPLSVSACL